MKCINCKKEIGFLRNLFIKRCKKCEEKHTDKLNKEMRKKEKKEKIEKEKREKEREQIDKAKGMLEKFEDNGFRDLEFGYTSALDNPEDYEEPEEDGMIFHKKDKKIKYFIGIREVCKLIIKNNFDVKNTLEQIEEGIEYKLHMDKLKEKDRKRKIKENAEKEFYGRIKSKRNHISSETKGNILRKFNNKCVICDRKEGLHIHHKDNNPQNNDPKNLIVLCGVCHKKAHMKVR